MLQCRVKNVRSMQKYKWSTEREKFLLLGACGGCLKPGVMSELFWENSLYTGKEEGRYCRHTEEHINSCCLEQTASCSVSGALSGSLEWLVWWDKNEQLGVKSKGAFYAKLNNLAFTLGNKTSLGKILIRGDRWSDFHFRKIALVAL